MHDNEDSHVSSSGLREPSHRKLLSSERLHSLTKHPKFRLQSSQSFGYKAAKVLLECELHFFPWSIWAICTSVSARTCSFVTWADFSTLAQADGSDIFRVLLHRCYPLRDLQLRKKFRTKFRPFFNNILVYCL